MKVYSFMLGNQTDISLAVVISWSAVVSWGNNSLPVTCKQKSFLLSPLSNRVYDNNFKNNNKVRFGINSLYLLGGTLGVFGTSSPLARCILLSFAGKSFAVRRKRVYCPLIQTMLLSSLREVGQLVSSDFTRYNVFYFLYHFYGQLALARDRYCTRAHMHWSHDLLF